MPVVAVGIIVFSCQKILLVKRGQPPGQNLWAIPGGKVKAGETLQAAAERELLEETGITVKAGRPIHTFDLIEYRQKDLRFHYVIVDLIATWLHGELNPADDVLDAAWVSQPELGSYALEQHTAEFLSNNPSLFTTCQ